MEKLKTKIIKPAIGIDLGTTNSCVAVFQNGQVEVIANSQGVRLTPSIVAFTDKERFIGEGAEIQQKMDPVNAIYNAKRFIGRKWDDPKVNESVSKYPFKVEESDNKIKFNVMCQKKNLVISPEEVSGAVLSRMKKIAEEYLEESIEDAVITVPAYFSDSQRQATKDAGKIAGLNVIRIINEPTAAAMAYGIQEKVVKEDGIHVLVYDLGGGTFDVSILEVEDDLLHVKATRGKTDLGGDDFNTILVRHFKKEIFRKVGVDLTPNHKAIRRLTNACEVLKRNLSAENTTQSRIELDAFLPEGQDFISTMSKAQFEHLCKGLFDETMEDVKQVIEDAGLTKDQIDEVVLVGGSSRIPKLQTMLRDYFSQKLLNKSINPDEAVACGAAIQAAILNGDQHKKVKDMLLMDVNPLSLGCDVEGQLTSIVLERNTPIPVMKSRVYTTAHNNQSAIRFTITEGERTKTKDNKILGSFTMQNIPASPRGEEKFDLSYEVDANGILKVTATHQQSKRKQGIIIDSRSSGKMSEAEINDLVTKAEKMKLLDQREENRIFSKCTLIAICDKIKFDAQSNDTEEVNRLLILVEDCLTWINLHPNAEESHFISKHDNLLKEAGSVFTKFEQEDSRRSSHVLRMNKITVKYYLEDGRACMTSGKIKDDLKALESFRKAYNIACEKGKPDKMAEASKEIGHVHRNLIEKSEKENEKPRHCIRAARRFATAIDQSHQKGRLAITKDMHYVADTFFVLIQNMKDEEKFPTLKSFMRPLKNVKSIDNKSWNEMLFKCYSKEIELYLKKIDMCLGQEKFAAALIYLNDLTFSTDQASFIAESNTDKQIISKLIFQMQACSNHANGLRLINLSENLLDGVLEKQVDAIDRALFALDHLNEAKNLTRELKTPIFIKAKLFEGKIFLDLILNKEKAKSCFEEIVNLTLSTEKYAENEWFNEAKFNFEQLQHQEDKAANPDISRETLLKELGDELKKLNKASETLDNIQFISFLFSTFPPRHRENYKIPKSSSQKKDYIRLSTFYHPDKVDADVYGQKYQVLCEEISKRINARFARM